MSELELEVMDDGLEEEFESNEEGDDGYGDLFHDIYVETATGTIYEVQLFDGYCLARAASPNYYAEIRKFSSVDFAREFHEYGGDADAVRNYLRNPGVDLLVE